MVGEALEAKSIVKRYGSVIALDGISLTVPTGEVFALVGPNGAGKTTLIRCLSGTTPLSNGRARILGKPPGDVDKSRIGLLPQDFTPPDRLTARELVAYYAGLYDESRPVGEVLSAVGMADQSEIRYRDLSGGQRRRTLVGTSFVNDPEVLFVDEPTTGIDPAGRRAVWELIESLTTGGTTVFLTSHDMVEIERLADRIGVIVAGNLVDVGTPTELLEAYGGGSRLLVITDDTEAVGESLAGHVVTVTDRGIHLDGIEPGDIGTIVDALSAANVTYDALTWQQPDLERVYLELAGDEISDGTATTGDGGR